MVAVNVLSTAFTAAYLVLAPHLSAHIASYLPLSLVEVSLSESNVNELGAACGFLGRYPAALKNVLAFAACGAVGQLFIFYTLAHFSSLLLVTVTVTRKMLTMLLSVVWFGHRLNKGQWAGVGLVFGGVGAEAIVQKREKEKRAAKKGQ
ncbi:UDP-galactose transporter [Ascosphaera atra]|nr:UDP-galactose transporter [Ascosphaera atra]